MVWDTMVFIQSSVSNNVQVGNQIKPVAAGMPT